MFEYIKGTYTGMKKDYIIIENNGIGYKINTSGSTIARMPAVGENVKLFLIQIVRQDFIGLYGFLTDEELEMFNMLLNINGIGARAALSLLTISSVNNLKYALLTGDEKTLMRAPGVGKKTAQRIILELKDKIKSTEISTLESNGGISVDEVSHNEALEALISLGYTSSEALKALKTVDTSATLENIIKNCLKFLMS
jgi:holliday junction DNA helicase RuvA